VAERLRNGDVVLIERRSQGWVSAAITLGAKLRYGFASPHAKYSHAAIVYDAGDPAAVRIVEATAASGVQRAFLAKYDPSEYDVVHTHVRDDDWKQVKDFLDDVLKKRTSYDYVTHVGLAVYALTGTRVCVQRAGTAICSGLVCDALTRAGKIWTRPPYACTPADISYHLQRGGPIQRRPSGTYRRRRRPRALSI
jgi:hypothetical protein